MIKDSKKYLQISKKKRLTVTKNIKRKSLRLFPTSIFVSGILLWLNLIVEYCCYDSQPLHRGHLLLECHFRLQSGLQKVKPRCPKSSYKKFNKGCAF